MSAPSPSHAEVVCVLGMHRSGTSCLAGTLEESGLELGDVVTYAQHNLKGNRENRRIMDLHDAVLKGSGGRWDAPPQHVTWTDAQREARDAIIASYASVRWGFKDPRTLMVLGGWQEALGNLRYVGTVRDPRLVAASLHRRERRPEMDWMALWLQYNERLLELQREHCFPIVCFDLPPDELRRRLKRAAESLGLSPPAELAFFEPEMRHLRPDAERAVPPRAAELYETLREISERTLG